MREILFRGKAINRDKGFHRTSYKNGEWVYGLISRLYDERFKNLPAEMINTDGIGGIEVDYKTISQYTGLTDKNGKKIFEGDIVDCWSEGVNAQGTVQQRKDGLWIIYPAWQKHIMWGLCPDEYSNTTVEVIGNIHDNPELLKEGVEQ
jgi:uncharacterized phage protein (TIGR01671 family)